jgi:hypothetical protein
MDDPDGRAEKSVGMRSLACWDSEFESRRRPGCLPRLNAVCCQEEVSATERSLLQRSLTDCVFVSLKVITCDNNYLYLQWVGRRAQIKNERIN